LETKVLNITVNIAGRPYKMTVKPQQEETVRKATKLVNRAITEYAHSFEYSDQQDLVAMVALQFATDAVSLQKEKNFREKEMEQKLKEMDQLLTSNI